MLTNLDNEVIFKRAFTDKLVFTSFVRDVLGIEIDVDKIETEKQFSPKIGNIDFKLDIFAESKDKRVAIELQRIQYDANFDRFLHYFLALIIEQQLRAKNYGIEQVVYPIVVMTEPYKISDKEGRPVRNEVLLMEINPKTLAGEKVHLYGHQFICLNPNHPEENTPQAIGDWLDLIYQSIHNPERPVLNKHHEGIQRAVELISYDLMPADQVAAMKNAEAARTVTFNNIYWQARKTAKVLHKKGISIAIIAEAVEFSEEEVQKMIDYKWED